MDHKTDQLIADKANILIPMETKTEQSMHTYLQVVKHASDHFKGQAEGNARPSEWSLLDEYGAQMAQRIATSLNHSKREKIEV